jgi:hypothetical protein
MERMNLRVILALLIAIFIAAAPAAASAASQPDFSAFTSNLNRQLEQLELQLSLTPAQKDQYVAAVIATKRVMLQLTMAGLQAKARLEEELAKPRPDLGILWELRQSIVEDGRSLRKEAREEWSKLYAMLDTDQIATFRRFLDERVDQLGLLHDFLMQFVLTPRERT